MKPIQALLALFAFAFLPLYAAGLADLTWTTTDGEITITDCDAATSGELVIPDTIGGNPVTSIGIQAFKNWVRDTTYPGWEEIWGTQTLVNTLLKNFPELHKHYALPPLPQS